MKNKIDIGLIVLLALAILITLSQVSSTTNFARFSAIDAIKSVGLSLMAKQPSASLQGSLTMLNGYIDSIIKQPQSSMSHNIIFKENISIFVQPEPPFDPQPPFAN